MNLENKIKCLNSVTKDFDDEEHMDDDKKGYISQIIGEILFKTANLAQKYHVNVETALEDILDMEIAKYERP